MKRIINIDGKLYIENASSNVICQDGYIYAQDDRWITINSDEESGRTGQHVLIREDGGIVAGLGGKFKNLKDLNKKTKDGDSRVVMSKEQAKQYAGTDSFAKNHSDGMEKDNVEYLPVRKFDKQPTEQEIINNIGGGDKTKGSCASVAMCYIAQRNGMDATDFRGGASLSFFSKSGHIRDVVGVDSIVSKNAETSDISSAVKCIKEMAKYSNGKEFLLVTGKHASIVRRGETGRIQFLELQSATANGWKDLTKDLLRIRFGCQQSHTLGGQRIKIPSYLYDCDKIKGSERFKYFLGYLNTDKNQQQKGEGGGIK